MAEEFDIAQFKDIFVSEAKEHLAVMNSALLLLEKNPQDVSQINEIFRVAHTLKGMAATMGFNKIAELTHNMEDILDKFRKGDLVISNEAIDTLFECFDTLEALVDEVSSGEDKGVDIKYLLEKLKEIEEETSETQGSIQKLLNNYQLDKEKIGKTSIVTKSTKVLSQKVTQTTQTVRIKIEQLDKLMDLVGELVIAKACIDEIAKRTHSIEITTAISQMDRLTSELQENVLKTRMVSVSYIFSQYPRLVRDLSRRLNKNIEFVMTGTDIEVDRVLLDQINEPLVHILRNAVDHGIEPPEIRRQLNKPETGLITLSVKREKGFVWIEVTDDGQGMDPEEIKQKAIEKGIITFEQASTLSEEEIFMLICHPAFSTAKEITDISGRGVGMDVVKNLVETFNGKLEIKSKKGVGSTFIMCFPLSLAIIQALLVKIGENEIYAIPFTNVNEIVKIEKEYIKTITKNKVLVLRDEVIPLINLNEFFKVGSITENYAVIIESRGKKIGLVVDSIIGLQEIVVKSLPKIVRNAKIFSGATILGDGRVVLIIDVIALCESFGLRISSVANAQGSYQTTS
ncbi:MAG: chemotaxis protein CheA [Candidatus Aenigmatarchaeota archaeon]